MNKCIGVNAKKELNSLMKNNRAPKRRYSSNQSSNLNMQIIKESSSKARDMMYEFADMLKDRVSNVKTSMAGSVHCEGNNVKFSCNDHEYNIKKSNLAMGAGVIAATALGAYVATKVISSKR